MTNQTFSTPGLKLGLPAGKYEVVGRSSTKYFFGSGYSSTTVRNLETGREYEIQTGNAQLIFGIN